MALIVETGTGAADSESYGSVSAADTYFAADNITLWATLSTPEKEACLRRATRYIDYTYFSRWAGVRMLSTQALDWPRDGARRRDGIAEYYDNEAIPSMLITATFEAAFRAASGELLADTERALIEDTVGPLTQRWDKSASQRKRYPVIDSLVAPLLRGSGFVVGRA